MSGQAFRLRLLGFAGQVLLAFGETQPLECIAMNIRPATLNDAETLARIHVAGWHESYGGIVPQEYLDSLSVDSRTKDWQRWLSSGEQFNTFLAFENEAPCGFISCGKLRTPPPGMSPVRPLYTSEIYGIYVLKEHWRKGIGKALMRAAAEDLRTRKHRSLCLWVIEKNKNAVAFYQKLGGQRCGKKDVEIGGRNLREICFGWRDTGALTSVQP